MENVIEKVKAAGLAGAGGAGFPTAVKLAADPEYLVVNGAECEPLLTVDQQLAAVYAAQLLETLDILVDEMGAKGAVFALKAKYHDAVANLAAELKRFPRLGLKTLPNLYPMGDEQVLLYEVLGRIVPEGGIPLNQKAVVINVETLLNVGRALNGLPLTEKYLTIAGEVKNPATLKVKIGLSARELIDYCGGATVKNPVIINGGPMMGPVIRDFETPVTKTTKGFLILPEDHLWVRSKERSTEEMMRVGKTACCHCQLCTDLCPRYLLGHQLRPDKLMRLASYNTTAEKNASAAEAFLCCECGLCEIACIMRLQPWKLNKELKRRLGALGLKNPLHNQPEKVNPFRAFRQYPIPKLIKNLGLTAYADQKAPLADYPLRPSKLVLPLKQHLGAPSTPVVEDGQQVAEGELIAKAAENALGIDHHAPLAGTVSLGRNEIVITVS